MEKYDHNNRCRRHRVESFCRICGIILENVPHGTLFCWDSLCRSRRNFLKKNRSEEHKRLYQEKHSEYLYKLHHRPWTSGCIDNLYRDFLSDKSITAIAKEIKRDEYEVIKKLDEILEKGFIELYLSYLKVELQLKTDELEAYYEYKKQLRKEFSGKVRSRII